MSELIDSNPILRDFAPIAGLELEIPTAPAPPTTPAEESPPDAPGELYIPPGGSLPGTDGPNGEFFLDQVALAKYIYENLPNELIGYGQTGAKPIQDGAIYGLHAGSRKEWTRFFMALINKESTFDTKAGGDKGRFGGDGYLPGSHGPLQLSHRDLENYKLPNITGTEDEIRAKLQDPKFNLALGFKIMTDLMTGRGDAVEGINVTRIGYSNPTNASIAPAGPNSTYERSAGPAKYWSPLRGAFFDKDNPTVRISDDVNNISAEMFTKAEESLLSALEIIKAEAAQASQAEREEPPNPSPEPQQRRDSARTSSGNRSNQQQNQNARRDSLKQPAPVQNELLYNNNTVFNFPGGGMSFGGGDFEEELQFNSGNTSGNSSLSLGAGIKAFTTGDVSTLSNNQFNTAKGTVNNSSTSTFSRAAEDVEESTGPTTYKEWEDLAKDGMASYGFENTPFRGNLTEGPSLQDPMAYSLGYHDTLEDESGNVLNPNNPTMAASDVPSTLKLFYKFEEGQVLRFGDDPNVVEYLGGEKASTPALIDPTGLNAIYGNGLQPIDVGGLMNSIPPVPLRTD
jgi:hypothetical protein